MGVLTAAELETSMSGKKTFRTSSSGRHVTEWPVSDVSSDLTIDIRNLLSYAQDLELGSVHMIDAIETIVSLLPAAQSRKSVVPIGFLSGLLKSAVAASASTSCRSDLERRIGLQLDQAAVEDLLIMPAELSASANGDGRPLYDTDVVQRIFSIFLNADGDDEKEKGFEFNGPASPKQSSIIKVSRVLDSYLAEVALDSNLIPTKFIALAELLPDHARIVYDGLYRAVDIYLKVHPNMTEPERYRLCKSIDCQKLSEEACSHAAQNERLPVQTSVQVLYFEQLRLRNAMNGVEGHHGFFVSSGHFRQRSGSGGAGSGCISPRDNYASVRRENRELKLEIVRMRMRLTDLEKDHVSMKQEMVRSSNPVNRMFKSFARKLQKIHHLMFRMNEVNINGGKGKGGGKGSLFLKRRRHSIS